MSGVNSAIPDPDASGEGSATAPELLRTALSERHRELGAKLADFGGWQMPIEYPGGGVLREHQAVRGAVGLFDVSHLGKVEVRGPGAAALVDSCLTNALSRISAGQAQYTLCCNDSGGVVDDLIVYLRAEDDVLLVPNAANSAEVSRLLATAAEGAPVSVQNRHADFVVLAVQGPRSDETLTAVGLPAGMDYMHFAQAEFAGQPVVVCRTGYTGERGYELIAPVAVALDLWDVTLEQVRAEGGLPVGLGARDTLRTEMGYPLHGHELTLDISPVQARAGWAVGWDKPRFWGREALLAEKQAGPKRVLRGLIAEGRGVPRAGMRVLEAGGESDLGVTTSGTHSPSLGKGIALALLDPSVALDSVVELDVRGRRLPMRVLNPPFVPAHVRD